ncbi:DUF803 domain protein [Aspergillus melleus]|uniref:DUF803 domain protein n=1 Tax=Aspergillus melleus TaxID=138277 RepID=UPI001E8EE5FC|nr:uncharacterized protein LDX57_009292 [Aspergillus melleus]KAH8431635.1 hypothetical protein LDX57_009292 [Aspergillus melleus]
MIGTAVLVLAILLGSKSLKYFTSSRAKHSSTRHPCSPCLQLPASRVRLIRGLSYGLVSGILSAHSLLLAKSAVELLVRTVVDRVNQFNRWQSWVILIAMISLALTQLFYLHRGLKQCSTSVLYPFVFCIYNIIAILDGLIYFRQMSQLTGFHAGLIALGTIVLLSGVLCLSWRLEVVDSHAAVTVPAPTQTALGPGMPVVDEHPHSPIGLEPEEDEENQIGEREPLLRAAPPPRGLPHRRTPSLPLLSPSHQRSSTDVDPASIWAELDDSDYEYADTDVQSPLLNRADPFQTRPRSKTGRDGSLRASRHHPLRPHRLSLSERRTSAPAAEIRKPQRRHLDSNTVHPLARGYGTQDDRSDQVFSSSQTHHRHSHSHTRHASSPNPTHTSNTHSHSQFHSRPRPLAGPRSVLNTAWRSLARWTGYGRRRPSEDPEALDSRFEDSHGL